MKSRLFVGVVFVLALMSAASGPLAQAAGPGASSPPTEGQKLVAKGQFAEGLAAVEQEIKADPQSPYLQLSKVDALLGLRRYREAAPLALRLGSTYPEGKYKAGLCAMAMGLPASAFQMWSSICGDPLWGGRATEGAVEALLAQGKEGEAKGLVEKALSSHASLPEGLLRTGIRLGIRGASMKAALESSAKGDPAAAELLKVWNAAGGGLFEESPVKAEPVVLAVKEKSEEVQTTSLQWGGGTYSPQAAGPEGTAAVSSSTQGYGAGMKSSADTEGGKTGTMSNLRRVVLQVAINGEREDPMVFSSQGDTVFITAPKAKKLGLAPVARGAYRGPGAPGDTPCDIVLIKEMKVGDVVFKNVPAKVIDPKTDYWKETAGILPLWLLRHHAMFYDRRGGKLTLYPPGTKPEPLMGQGTFRVKNQWEGGAPYVETDLEGKPGTFLLMDLSLPSTYLSEDALPSLGLTVNVTRYGHRQEVGLFGVYSYGVAERATLVLGPAKIDLAGVRAAEVGTGLADWSCGALGRETLDLFQVFVDYPSNVLAFKGYGK